MPARAQVHVGQREESVAEGRGRESSRMRMNQEKPNEMQDTVFMQTLKYAGAGQRHASKNHVH